MLEMAVPEWPALPMETSGDPHAMSQDEQDRLSLNPRWTPAFASSSSASNSAYYFTLTTQAAARVVFLYGLVPAPVAILAHGGPAVFLVAEPRAVGHPDVQPHARCRHR